MRQLKKITMLIGILFSSVLLLPTNSSAVSSASAPTTMQNQTLSNQVLALTAREKVGYIQQQRKSTGATGQGQTTVTRIKTSTGTPTAGQPNPPPSSQRSVRLGPDKVRVGGNVYHTNAVEATSENPYGLSSAEYGRWEKEKPNLDI